MGCELLNEAIDQLVQEDEEPLQLVQLAHSIVLLTGADGGTILRSTFRFQLQKIVLIDNHLSFFSHSTKSTALVIRGDNLGALLEMLEHPVAGEYHLIIFPSVLAPLHLTEQFLNLLNLLIVDALECFN